MVLNADYLLAIILAGEKSISFRDLNRIGYGIEEHCPGVVVDVSSPAVNSAIEYYPQIFARREREITRASNADRFLKTDYLDNEFIRCVPCAVHKEVQNVIHGLLHSS